VPAGPLKATPDPAAGNGTTTGGRPIPLGLSIAQTIAELHAGSIIARNIPAGGCELIVRLPADATSTPAAAMTEHAAPRAVEPPAR
jgi:K+-sensing histidine kinase KdpD